VTALAHTGANSTERAAATRASRFAGSQRARLLQLVIDAGDAGLTAPEAYELYVALYGDPAGGYNSIAPRLSQMRRQYGDVDFGTVRGRRGAYVATAAGREKASAA
jgi:hypothetical protein